jgi:hypothetical protein
MKDFKNFKIAEVLINDTWEFVSCVGSSVVGFYVVRTVDIAEFGIDDILTRFLFYGEVSSIEDSFDFVKEYFDDCRNFTRM